MKKNKETLNPINEKHDINEFIKTNPETGLNDEQVLLSREKFGENKLAKQKNDNFLKIFFKNLLFDLMSLLLFISSILGLGLGIYQHIDGNDALLSFIQSGVLFFIVVINALFGTIQESKSNKAVQELEKMAKTMSKVLRNGKIVAINSEDIVIGDILVVESGDVVTADAKLVYTSNLKASESILTGESNEIWKDETFVSNDQIPIGERKNIIYNGTQITNGKGYAIVISIGNETELGKIASLLNNKEKMMTPLQHKLHKLGQKLGIVGIFITIATFIFSLFVMNDIINATDKVNSFIQALFIGISLAAAAIPEGMSAVINIVLSIGINKMSERNAIIKKLPAVETLGSTSIICSDKTGTLTMNKMTLVSTWVPSLNKEDIFLEKKELTKEQIELLKLGILNTDCVVDENKKEKSIGDPTEIAIVDYFLKQDKSSVEEQKKLFPRLKEFPFDSTRKMMSTFHKIDNETIMITKGAPDVLFNLSINKDVVDEAKKINEFLSNKGIRVIAIAKKVITKDISEIHNQEECENDFELLGLFAMIDPPREEVKKSIQECISAGIKPIMITGDHLNTAVSIAKELMIITDDKTQLAITGSELDNMDDNYLFENIEKYSVYARVSPENKIRIVKAWQSKDQVVAMTGDGVNDAPALKAADIGCAMGITGTDVSKNAADMVLMDDNFSTIVESVKSGRSIYNNIKRIITFLLSSNLSSVITIVVGMLMFFLVFKFAGWGNITESDLASFIAITDKAKLAKDLNNHVTFVSSITTIQILINNIIIETLPGIAIGIQKNDVNNMNVRPRSKYESIFADGVIKKILLSGIINGILAIVGYALGVLIAIETGNPLLRFYWGSLLAFITLTFGGVLKSISMSTSQSIFKTKFDINKFVYAASGISIIIILLITLIPQVSFIFGEGPNISSLDGYSKDVLNELSSKLANNSILPHYAIYLTGISLAILSLFIFELIKFIESKNKKTQNDQKITTFELIKRPLTYKQRRSS